MSTEFAIKFLFTGIVSLVIAWAIFSRCDEEIGEGTKYNGEEKYLPQIHGALLPAVLLVMVLLGLKFYGGQLTAKMMLTVCFDIFLHTAIYYGILVLIMPFLRKYIAARTCAMMWLMPNYLYLTQQSFMKNASPLFVIHVPGRLIEILAAVWLIGFTAVLLWNVAGHIIFRRKILKNAELAADPAILKVLHDEVEDAGIKKARFKLVMTPDVETPLTIGLFKRSVRIVLPERTYSADDLKLIFRHELVHIGREDSWSKFFMIFCTAMCWFNPLMWFAMKKSAEDLELSCDETVLLNADDETRNRYANLILRSAGDDRGFSTCLSASAEAMHYRLKSIVKPAKRRTGALIAAAIFFILCITSGYVALAYGEATGADTVFQGKELANFTVSEIDADGGRYSTATDNIDADALTGYIAGLKTQEMTGNYTYSDDEKSLLLWYDSPDGFMIVDLHTTYVKSFYWKDVTDITTVYHLPESVDWDYVDSIVPPIPVITAVLSYGEPYGDSDLDASVNKLVYTKDGESRILKDLDLQPYESASIYSSSTFTDAKLSFSMPLAEPAEILIESWDYKTSYRVKQKDMVETFAFKLPAYPAHYTVYAALDDQKGGIYEAEYRFDIGEN